MARTQVVQFFADGTVAHTRDPKLDIASMLGASRKIERMTDIKFDEGNQKFYAVFLRGQMPVEIERALRWDGPGLAGLVVTSALESAIESNLDSTQPFHPGVVSDTAHDGTILFNTYEDAVSYEIAVVNALRLLGAVF